MYSIPPNQNATTETFQKLSEAAERRRIQNRNAQRRYRENLKKKLEVYEGRKCRKRKTASSPSASASSSSSTESEYAPNEPPANQDDDFAPYMSPSSSQANTPEPFDPFFRSDTIGFGPLHLDPFLSHSQLPLLLPPDSLEYPLFPDNSSTMLHLAARKGFHTIIHLLLESGIDMNSQDTYGQTALHVAAANGQAEALLALLEAGVNVEIRNGQGQTALVVAVVAGQEECVKVLIARGADVCAKF
ncbi:ankyrin repeat-containing domain protein [Tricladium varicosporioides]|nr:ankyrin repeat-containing domain protein [Hymenoscyphus varicosporioides]